MNDTNDNKEKFDPQERDDKYYSQNPYQHGSANDKSSGKVDSEGNVIASSETGEIRQDNTRVDQEHYKGSHGWKTHWETRPDTHGSSEKWDVNPNTIENNNRGAANAPDKIESGLPSSLEGLPDNPSDEALFVRKGATYLEEDDKPSESYDPHHMGYGNKDEEKDKS